MKPDITSATEKHFALFSCGKMSSKWGTGCLGTLIAFLKLLMVFDGSKQILNLSFVSLIVMLLHQAVGSLSILSNCSLILSCLATGCWWMASWAGVTFGSKSKETGFPNCPNPVCTSGNASSIHSRVILARQDGNNMFGGIRGAGIGSGSIGMSLACKFSGIGCCNGACPVWSPHLAKDIHEIEKVQRRASRIALDRRRQEMAYGERCKLLKWNSLVRRREFLSLVECYKIVFNLNGLNFGDYFELCRNTKTRSNHPYKIQTKLAKLNCFKHSFFVKIIKSWSDLPSNVFNCNDSPNVSKFKLRLKNHMNIY